MVMLPDEREVPSTVDQWAYCLLGKIDGELHHTKVAQALLTLGHPDHMTTAIVNAVYGYGALDLSDVPEPVILACYEYMLRKKQHNDPRFSSARTEQMMATLCGIRAAEQRRTNRRRRRKSSRRKSRRHNRRR